MYSKVTIFGHPVHPMLIPFPIAFYTATVVSFITYAANANPFWFRVALVANTAAVVMAAVAGLIGFLDLTLGIPSGTDAKRHGWQHMGLNLFSLALFAINLWLNIGQWNAPVPIGRYSILLPVVGFLATLGAGYLGWTLVQTHHVGVVFTPNEERCVRIDRERREFPKRKAA